MPEATAQLIKPDTEQKPVIIDEALKDINRQIDRNSDLATNSTGPLHNSIPIKEQPVPIAIFGDINKPSKPAKSKTQPGTYEPDKNMLSHYMPEIPGVVVDLATRTAEAKTDILPVQEGRKAKVLEHANQGTNKPGVFQRIGDWFMENKTAA